MKRCARCVLPRTTPNITFDEDGECNYCQSYRPAPLIGEEELHRQISSNRRSGSRYDCLIGVSGGRDSTYALLKMAGDYGYSVLAVNYANPFADPQAAENVRNAVESLGGADLVSFTLPHMVHERTFAHNLRAWLRRPSPAMIPMLCIACKTINARLIHYAKKHDIATIVTGGNPYEDTAFKKELLNLSRDEDYYHYYRRSAGGVLREIARNPAYLAPVCLPTMARGYLFGDNHAMGPKIFARRIHFIDLFLYIPWVEKTVLSRIDSEMGWRKPAAAASSWRSDCRISHLKDALYLLMIGMTEKDDFYAKMVRHGDMSRDEALKRLEAENRPNIDEIRELLRFAGVEADPFFRKLDELR